MENESEYFDSMESVESLKAAEKSAETDHGRLGNLLRKIPGMAGHFERNDRRKADQLLRDTIAGRLEETRLQLSNVYPALSRDIIMAMTYAEALGRSNTRLAGLIRKIESAPAGYASMFSSNEIDTDKLERIYAFDERFLEQAMQIEAAVAALDAAVNGGGGIDAAMSTLDKALQDANSAFDARQELLSGFSG
ncbi:MAG: hypothetical protein ACPG8W_25420 [Candidatus Promineifilaceae bacterium]